MKALKGRLLRVCDDHRRKAGKAYSAFCAPFVERFGGQVPPQARRLLVELWRMEGELDALAADWERATAQRRRRDANRAKRQQAFARRNYTRMLATLHAMVAAQPTDLSRLLGGGER